MSMATLEKAREWPKMNHEDDILMHSRLNDLAISSNI